MPTPRLTSPFLAQANQSPSRRNPKAKNYSFFGRLEFSLRLRRYPCLRMVDPSLNKPPDLLYTVTLGSFQV